MRLLKRRYILLAKGILVALNVLLAWFDSQRYFFFRGLFFRRRDRLRAFRRIWRIPLSSLLPASNAFTPDIISFFTIVPPLQFKQYFIFLWDNCIQFHHNLIIEYDRNPVNGVCWTKIMDYYEPFKIQTAANNVSVRIERRQRTGLYLFSSAGSSHAGR